MHEITINHVRTSGLPKIVLIILASCLLLSPLVVSASFGTSSLPNVIHRTLTSSAPQTDGSFGFSSAASGNIVVVGAYEEAVSGNFGAGHAYVFNAKTGALVTTLQSPNAQGSGFFGISVAASGNLIVVGANAETGSGEPGAGNAYVFNAMTGDLVTSLTSPNAQLYGSFGASVAINGSIVVVGAPVEYSSAGHAYAFNAKTGALISTLESPNQQTDGYFGSSVGVSGSIAIVGAEGETVSGYTSAGHEYVFNAKTGTEIRTLQSKNPQTSGYFGVSSAISGSTIVVGAEQETSSGYTYAGNVYSFNEKTGALIRTLSSPNVQTNGYFGESVSLSGKSVVVGAPDETYSGYSRGGHAYLFNAKTGSLLGTFGSKNAQTDGFFGFSVGVVGSIVVVGAWGETVSGYVDAGRAYIF
jgi:hypothetical protein